MMTKYAYRMDDEFNEDQKNDLDLLMSLNTKEDKENWLRSVDEEDFYYGMSLLLAASIKEQEYELDKTQDYSTAASVIEYIKSLS